MTQKVAIIGTGPSGMAAAQILLQDGYEVTMYEKADRPGGILMYGIPHMKVNKNNVLRKAENLEKMGAKIICNTYVSKETIAEDIMHNFDAVLLATGAEHARDG